MGTIVEATAIATADDRSQSASAIELANAAARACLERADRTPDDVQLLINAGVYLDRNISEPAIAALIQEDIGANPDIQPGAGQGTLSFDVRNGACGMLTGMYLVDGLLASGTVQCGMVVGGDVNPEPGISEGFGFPAAAGAVVLSWDHSRPGLTAFKFKTFPEFVDEFQSFIAWDEAPGNGHGRNALTVEIDEHYRAHALACAESTVHELAAENGLDLAEVDLLIATASVPDFAAALGHKLGITQARIASLSDGFAGAHTAAPAIARERVQSLQPGTPRTALVVSAGAGITVVAALHRA
jgi:3-oxoacyl-[acyl-carrier-protein] synthase III